MRVFKSDEFLHPVMGAKVLIDRLNEALGWELRAMSMYAHYACLLYTSPSPRDDR